MLQTQKRGLSVCLSVCQSVTTVSAAKTAEPIVWDEDSRGPKEPCIRQGPGPVPNM